MSPLDDDALARLAKTPPPADLDAAPDPDHPGYIALPADTDPASWNSLDDVLADVARALPFEAWGELQEEAEDG